LFEQATEEMRMRKGRGMKMNRERSAKFGFLIAHGL
jgi:hypothetical protein